MQILFTLYSLGITGGGESLCVLVRVLFLPFLRILDPLSIGPSDAESMDARGQLQQWWPSPYY